MSTTNNSATVAKMVAEFDRAQATKLATRGKTLRSAQCAEQTAQRFASVLKLAIGAALGGAALAMLVAVTGAL